MNSILLWIILIPIVEIYLLIKIGSQIDVFLERIESFKGELIISRDKAKKMKSWKKRKILRRMVENG